MSSSSFMDAIVLFGDSLTQAPTGGSFVQRMSEYYLRRLDRALMAGYNTEWAIPVFEQMWATKAERDAGKAQNVQLLVMWFGANDAVLPHRDQHVALPRFQSNLLHLIDAVRSPSSPYHSPGTRIVLVAPPPVIESARHAGMLDKWESFGKEGPEPVLDRDRARTREFARAVVDLGHAHGVPTVDLWSTIVDAAGGQDDAQLAPYFYDGLHLTAAGYKLLFDKITSLIVETWPELDPETMAMAMPHFSNIDPANPRAAFAPKKDVDAKARVQDEL
ncbi:hypothetical protein Q5752_002571 [Cryptotrichosporon argae]